MVAETFQFQAETKQLLDLMIHSLYTNKEIFLRELISNASDAIDKLRFEALTQPELLADGDQFEVRLEIDPQARILTIRDNGIGMSREEVINNIGTIAKSGTQQMREKLQQAQQEGAAALIGQFGVGFYSAFMVADKVTLTTRRAGESTATYWESTGNGEYTINSTTQDRRGTTINLHLKPADSEAGLEDYTDNYILGQTVRKHSDFVAYPVIIKEERQEIERDADGKPIPDGKKTTVIEDKVLNSMKPLWLRSQSEVSESEYAEFYRHISHDWSEPLKTISLRAEGRIEYQALLFIPSRAPHDLYFPSAEYGLRLYAKRVMIIEKCEELLPKYLRFMRGIVDSADLPLNISRQTLQQDRHITQIRKWITKKVVDTLKELQEKDAEKYLNLWKELGNVIKEGIDQDSDNRERLLDLALFETSHQESPSNLTTLKQYVARMKPDQPEIYYLTGESRTQAEQSPHLEAFQEKGYEVLYFVHPIEEIMAQSVREFEGKKLKSISKGQVSLGDESETAALKEQETENAALLQLLQKALDSHVKEVKLSNRLTTSPVCLTNAEHEFSPHLERLLQQGQPGMPRQRRIMELNPKHDLFQKLQDRFRQNAEDTLIADYAELLLGYGLIAEGSDLVDPGKFNRLVANLMLRGL